MESANLHHQHQLQDQLVVSSSLATTSCYGVGNTHAWTPNPFLNTGNFNPSINGSIISSRDSRHQNDILFPSLNSSMVQDFDIHCASAAGSFNSRSAHDLQLARIKEEFSDSYTKFTDMLKSPSSSIEDAHIHPTSYIKDEQRDANVLAEKLLLRTFSSGCQINAIQFPAGDIYSNAQNFSSSGSVATDSRGIFSQIFPTINISNLNQSSSAISSSSDVNLHSLDLFNFATLNGGLSQASQDQIPPFTNRVIEAKRRSSILEPKAPQATPKKSRLESRASCPPFKVRKEKLGDRIAALQQLVAPFGKTDTASVLMEAFGYIKFLQSQVETLSVPYMKSSRNKTSRTMQGGSADNENEEPKRDLRSRGLCLVPLSCLSYITDGGGGVWPPPNFNGGT